MISMTGYAYREISEESISLSVEIRGYNSRYLEISVNTPSWLVSVEPAVRDIIAKACHRGKIEAAIRIWENNIPVKVSVNLDAAKAYKLAIDALAKELNIKEKPGLALLLSLDGVLAIEKERDSSRYWNTIEPVLHNTVTAFNESRAKEGALTGEDILKQVGRLETSLEIISSFAKAMEDSIKDTVRTRFVELLGDKADDNRIMAETAALLVKATISEEIARLGAHMGELKSELAGNAHPGKKLDFLCQEINREVNTIGSKSSILEVSRAVVEMKDALENVREQLRNVE